MSSLPELVAKVKEHTGRTDVDPTMYILQAMREVSRSGEYIDDMYTLSFHPADALEYRAGYALYDLIRMLESTQNLHGIQGAPPPPMVFRRLLGLQYGTGQVIEYMSPAMLLQRKRTCAKDPHYVVYSQGVIGISMSYEEYQGFQALDPHSDIAQQQLFHSTILTLPLGLTGDDGNGGGWDGGWSRNYYPPQQGMDIQTWHFNGAWELLYLYAVAAVFAAVGDDASYRIWEGRYQIALRRFAADKAGEVYQHLTQ